jgi:hypothetical protein
MRASIMAKHSAEKDEVDGGRLLEKEIYSIGIVKE